MKKTPARILAAAIALLLAISLSACGDSFESAMARALSEMQDVESLHMDMVMSLDMSLSAEGQTIDLPISMDMSMDTINEPLTAHATMNMNVMQQPVGVEYYLEQSGENYQMYANMDGGGWESMSMDETELGQFSAVDGVEFYLQCASAFEKVGEEEVRGATASRYDGEIPADMLAEAFERSGAYDMFESLGVSGESTDGLTSGMGLSIYLDNETGLPVRYDIDMTDLMREMMEATLAAVGAGDAMSWEIGEASVSVTLSEFNGIDAIEIPDAARGA
mgnify:FL=1